MKCRLFFLTMAIVGLSALALAAADPTFFGEQDADKTQTLAVGQEAILGLEMAGGTGYVWQIKIADESIVTMTKKETQVGNPMLMGGPVKMLFFLKAKTKGKTTLDAWLSRPWKDDEKLKQFTYTIEVK